jgi:phage terminase large subunit GpA-like protein
MDALSTSHPARRIVLMWAAQTGKTEIGNNWLGYIMHHAPGPVLIVQPTVELAKRMSKQRIAPMLASTPELAKLVAEPRSRDSGNTVQVKEFRGGLLVLTGANSGSGLRQMPMRYLFADEIDEYPGDVGGQGDPVALAEKRMTTFEQTYKELLTSTPTIRGVSRIELELFRTDQRRYFIKCPFCGHFDFLTWSGFADFVRGEGGGHHFIEWEDGKPETAHMVCGGCQSRVEEKYKTEMLAGGAWKATATGDGTTIGYHLSALYSPLGWKSWGKCAMEFLAAKSDPFKLKTWVNTVLAETWEERGDAIDPDSLKARRKPYANEVPSGVGVLVAAVDVQGDRLEVKVKGYGHLEESWLISYAELRGDPATAAPWNALSTFLANEYDHENGRTMRVELTTVDSGGLHTEQVYRYCRAQLNAQIRVVPIKGGSVSGRPLVERPSTHNSYQVPLFVLCVDTGKDIVMARMQARLPGPGYMHLPEWPDDEYLAQLTAERAVRKYVKGRGAVREWVKLRERNEAFDLEVYCLAALYILGPYFIKRLKDMAAKWASKPEGSPGTPVATAAPGAESAPVPIPRPPKTNWITGDMGPWRL